MRFDHTLLRRLRLDLELTQAAAAAAVGVDVRTWRRYESGAVNGARGFEIRRAGRRALLARMSTEFGVCEDDWLIDEAAPAPAPKGVSEPTSALRRPAGRVHPLPRARHFTGRAALVERLARWASEPAPADRVVALIGLGGAGKTSVIERLLAAWDAERWGPVWSWSVYEDPRPEALLRTLCQSMGVESDPPGAAPSRICAALSMLGPCTLVIDGLELVQSPGDGIRARGEAVDPALRRLLRGLAGGAGGCRALITTRLPLADLDGWRDGGYAPIELDSLTPSAGIGLLRRWGVRGDEAELARLVEQAGGHPLTLAMTGAWIEAFGDGDARAARSIPDPAPMADLDPRARRLDAVLRAYVDALDPCDRALLVRLSLFEHGVDPETLAAVAAEPEAAGETAGLDARTIGLRLRRLAHRSLVHRLGDGRRWGAHPLLRARFRRLNAAPAGAVESAVAGHLARAGLDPAERPGPDAASAVLDRAEALMIAMLRAGRVDAALSVYRRGLGAWSHLGLHLEQTGRLLRLLAAFATAGTPETLTDDLGRAARLELAYQWSLAATSAGDLVLSRRALDVARELVDDSSAYAVTERAVAYVDWLAGRLDSARDAATAARTAADAIARPGAVARAEALSGAIAHAIGDDAAAAAHFDAARARDGEGLVARRGVWIADWLTGRGEAIRAVAHLERNVAVCERRQWPAHATLARLALIDASLAAGATARAHAVAREVRPAVERTGEFEVRLRALAVEADLAESTGDRLSADRLRARGATLARDGGFFHALRRFEDR